MPTIYRRTRRGDLPEVAPAGPFWEAEPKYEDDLQRIPNGCTCHLVRPRWKLPVREAAS